MPVRNPNGKNVTQLILSRRAAEVIESQRIKAVAFLRLGGEHLFLSTKNTDGHEISSARNVGFADDAYQATLSIQCDRQHSLKGRRPL